MLKMWKIFVVVAALAASAAGVQAIGKDFSIAGSTGAIKTVIVPLRAAIEKELGTTLNIDASGSSKGVRYLAEGKIDLAILSALPSDVIPNVNRKYELSLKASDFQEHVVFEQELAIIVHKLNPVSSISRDQLRGIFSGEITNWKDVGGKDEKITVITEEKGSGVRTLVESTLLSGSSYTADVKLAANSSQSAAFVNGLTTSISSASLANVRGSKVLSIKGGGIVQRYYLVSMGSFNDRAGVVAEIITSANR